MRGRRVRRFRKRRVIRRRRFRRRHSQYDSNIARKIVQTINMVYDGGNSWSQVNVQWYSANAPAGFVNMQVTGTREFLNFQPSFNLYKVQGCKIEVLPSRPVMTTNQPCMFQSIMMASLVNGTDFIPLVSDQVLRTADDFKEWPGQSIRCKKYIGVSKYLSRNNRPKYYSTVPALVPTNEEQTIVRINGSGFNNGNTIAVCKVTWYVKFKHSIA